MTEFASVFVELDAQVLGVEAGSAALPIRLVREKEETGCVSCTLKPHFETPDA